MKRILLSPRSSRLALRSWWRSRPARIDLTDERGDVPGWGLVTLMTAR